MQGAGGQFAGLVDQILDQVVESGDVVSGQTATVAELTAQLSARLERFRASGVDPDEIADQAIYRFVEVASTGGIDRLRAPAAYLDRIATNLAIDARRRLRGQTGWESQAEYGSEDERIVRLLEADADVSRVEQALSRAVAAGDDTVFQVIVVWLDLADETGTAPTLREVGARLGLSHTAVGQARDRFRAYL